jgi:hyperosmotically inducible protein
VSHLDHYGVYSFRIIPALGRESTLTSVGDPQLSNQSNYGVRCVPSTGKARSLASLFQEEITMKAVHSTIVRTFLCAGLLLGAGAVAVAQDAGQQGPVAADNTKVNQRDRSQNEPTADQQKDNRSDRDVTQQIRDSIMKDKSLSAYAHNVKIITQNGQVTLKGPVRSEDEKKLIEAKAIEVAGDNKVTSQLDIKPKK